MGICLILFWNNYILIAVLSSGTFLTKACLHGWKITQQTGENCHLMGHFCWHGLALMKLFLVLKILNVFNFSPPLHYVFITASASSLCLEAMKLKAFPFLDDALRCLNTENDQVCFNNWLILLWNTTFKGWFRRIRFSHQRISACYSNQFQSFSDTWRWISCSTVFFYFPRKTSTLQYLLVWRIPKWISLV